MVTDPFFEWNHQDLVGLIAGQPPQFAPGTQGHYSNTNYLLLGLGVMSAGGYLGHNGELTGYEAVIAHDLVVSCRSTS